MNERRIKKSLSWILVFTMILTMWVPLGVHAASEADYTFSVTVPETVMQGDTFTAELTVLSQTKSKLDFVQTSLQYPVDKIGYVSMSDAQTGIRVSVDPEHADRLLITGYDMNCTVSAEKKTLVKMAFQTTSETGDIRLKLLASESLAGESGSALQPSDNTLQVEDAETTVQEAAPETADISWYSEDADSFSIGTAAQLAGLAQLVNEGNDFIGKTILLSDDINLAGFANWTPIGSNTLTVNGTTSSIEGNCAFAGVFDGQKHNISGLKASDEQGGIALFGYATGTLKDFQLSGTVTGNYFTAGVCAYGSGIMEGITSSVNVSAEQNCVGGILADAAGTITIRDCHNSGMLTNNGASSEKSTGRMGGIVGRIETGITAKIINCSNSGDITAYQYIGGIIGGCFGDVSIQNCCNTGTVTGISFGKVYLGGIAGKLGGGTIDSCYNLGALNDSPWNSGHIRGVGGIAGCEQDHTEGTAITSCYNAGTITLDTQHMTIGANFIYMSGNISGGNQSSDANTMHYQNCFYLEGSFPAQSADHSAYAYWSDNFKEDSTVYDTMDIVKKTSAELKSPEIVTLLGSNYRENQQGGYPVLYWEDGAQAPEEQTHGITYSVSGGTAEVTVVSEAKAGTEVGLQVNDIAGGKQLKRVSAKDTSGAEVTLSAAGGQNGSYTFTMPNRGVTITVILENTPEAGAEAYPLTLPTGLDGIWSVSVDATYYNEAAGAATAGSTVTIVVEKEEAAVTTGFDGILVTAGNENISVSAENERSVSKARCYGEYTFTMPAAAATVALQQTYTPFVLKTQYGTHAAVDLMEFTRAEMESLSPQTGCCYSGWSTETTPFIGFAKSYVTLEELLSQSHQSFAEGDKLILTAADGFSQTITYESLVGTERSFYSDILTKGTQAGKAEGTKQEFQPCFVICGNTTTSAEDHPEQLVCDTLNAYRFVYGQTEAELTNHTKIVDSLPKCVVSATIWHPLAAEIVSYTFETTPAEATVVLKDAKGTVVTPASEKTYQLTAGELYYYTIEANGYITAKGSILPKDVTAVQTITLNQGSGGGGEGSTGSGNVSADVWDGYSIDVSWYSKDADSYSISTPAQLAGLAAIVNGIYNKEIDTFKGDTSCIVDHHSVSSGNGPSGNNRSTAEYHYGGDNFAGKTVYLTRDIDMSGGNYMPIGGQYLMTKDDSNTRIDASFCGVLNGRGHEVCISCSRRCTTGNYGDGQSVGLIGRLGVHDDDDTSLRPSGAGVCNLAVSGNVEANRSVGGVVGKIGKTSGGVTIENCANFASIKNTDAKGCGGIVGAGWNGGVIQNCYNTGSVTSTYQCPTGGISGSNEIQIINCYNVGKISAASDSYAMAIGTNAGGAPLSAIKNCYYLIGSAPGGGYYSGNSNDDAEGCCVGKTSDEMKSDEFLNSLDKGTFASDDSKINNGYPVLKWQASSQAKESTGGGGAAQETKQEETPAAQETVISEVKVTDGKAKTEVSKEQLAQSMENISAESKAELVINAVSGNAEVKEAQISLPKESLASLQKDSNATLVVKTDVAEITVPNENLSALTAAAGESINLSLEKNADGSITLSIQAAGKSIEASKPVLKLSFKVSLTQASSAQVKAKAISSALKPEYAAVMLNADGSTEIVRNSVIRSDGEVTLMMGTEGTVSVRENAKEFSDVADTAWFCDAVKFAASHELFRGLSDNEFAPEAGMTRGMFVTVLNRLASAEKDAAAGNFTDVPEGSWYKTAVAWAADNDIVSGYGDGIFGPENAVTREQMAVIMYKYTKYMGYDITGTASLESFSDGENVDSWATDAMSWAVGAGILSGNADGTLDPTGTATRAQVAQILTNYEAVLLGLKL